jgi:hypothetical protein
MLNVLFGVAYELETPFFPQLAAPNSAPKTASFDLARSAQSRRSLNVSPLGWQTKAAPALPAVAPVPAKRCGTLRDKAVAGLEDVCVVERKDLPSLAHSCTAKRTSFIRVGLGVRYPHQLLNATNTLSHVTNLPISTHALSRSGRHSFSGPLSLRRNSATAEMSSM